MTMTEFFIIWLGSLLVSWVGLGALGSMGFLSGDWGMVLAVATLAALWFSLRCRLARMEKKLDRLLADRKENAETGGVEEGARTP